MLFIPIVNHIYMHSPAGFWDLLPFCLMVHMILLTLFCLLAAVDGQPNGTTCAPSPTGFRDLFINMCTNLQLREWDEGSSSQCAGYWDAFSSSFANMDPSSVTTK